MIQWVFLVSVGMFIDRWALADAEAEPQMGILMFGSGRPGSDLLPHVGQLAYVYLLFIKNDFLMRYHVHSRN